MNANVHVLAAAHANLQGTTDELAPPVRAGPTCQRPRASPASQRSSVPSPQRNGYLTSRSRSLTPNPPPYKPTYLEHSSSLSDSDMNSSTGVTVVERTVTVHYLAPSMCRELLGKFPDPSAFDFDYSQSAIWSPLPPRPSHAPDDDDDQLVTSSRDDLIPKPKRRARTGWRDANDASRASRWQRRRRRSKAFIDLPVTGMRKLDFSPPSSSPIKAASPVGWRRVLKAAMKRFKARQRRSRPARLLQMMLPML